jgi:rhodanese-related sulfurtransferase
VEYAVLGIAVLALIVALVARSTASKLRQGIEDARNDARRRVESSEEETKAELETLRRIVGRMAGGEKLSPEMVLEGRLWSEASPDEGKKMVAEGGLRLLDVRTQQETAQGIITGAVLIPVQELEERFREIPKDGKKTLVYCAGGQRSAAACEFLSRQGYEGLYNLAGGFMSWSGPRAKPG